MDLKDNKIHPYSYNHKHGENAAEHVIQILRENINRK